MAVRVKLMATLVGTLGVVSFLLAIIAERIKPAEVTPITGEGVVICKYPSDPTIALGYLSVVFLVASSLAGCLSLFYPYKGKFVPQAVFFRNTNFVVFFNIALATAGIAVALTLWPTITKQRHMSRNVHEEADAKCHTASPGILGGAAFISLDSSLFWLCSLILANNAREDYFAEVQGNIDQFMDTTDRA